MVFWDRQKLKARAKEVLRSNYWMIFLALLLCALAQGVLTASYDVNIDLPNGGYHAHIPSLLERIIPGLAVMGGVSGAIGTVWSLLVARPFEVGECRYLTLCRYGEVDTGNILYAYRGERYWHIVLTMFLRDLKVVLWSLLLIVPGVIKAYEYFMVPYILAENPYLSRERAFEISRQATQGEKGEMFVMDLSFLGWYLLGALCLGVGIFFVRPYDRATHAELYGALRYKCAKTGICTRDELAAELFDEA